MPSRSRRTAALTRKVPGAHASLGAAVGPTVGGTVGGAAGSAVGDAVGSPVGSPVGSAVEAAVGATVGAGVGTSTHPEAPLKPAVHVVTAHAWHSWYAPLSWNLPLGQW
jgi:hypothetical protein